MHPTNGDVYISDGYGNSRVHRYDSEGIHIQSWGEPGALDGQFSLPHNICLNGDTIVVADRENFRLQVFSLTGEFLGQKHMHRPIAISNGRPGDPNIYVAEAGPPPVQEGVRNLGRRVAVLNSGPRRDRRVRRCTRRPASQPTASTARSSHRLHRRSLRSRSLLHRLRISADTTTRGSKPTQMGKDGMSLHASVPSSRHDDGGAPSTRTSSRSGSPVAVAKRVLNRSLPSIT